MFTLIAAEGGLGAKVGSPAYWAVRVYCPPGRLLTLMEIDPLLSVRNPTGTGGEGLTNPGAEIELL